MLKRFYVCFWGIRIDNAANQDNGFDIFADVPTDIDDEDVSIGNMFDDNTAASVLVTQLPAESPDR